MKFFKKKKAAAPSRRQLKLWFMRLKAAGAVTAVAGLLGSGIFYAWQNGIIGAFGAWTNDKIMTYSALAGFTVNDIMVTGRGHITQKELIDHINIHEGAPIFAVNIEDAQKSLAEISWVDHAAVVRRLPGTIVVTITERKPAAIWQMNKKLSVIDAEGHVLTAGKTDEFQGLPLLVGEGAPDEAAALLTLMNAEPDISSRVSSAVRVGNRRWDLHLKNGMLVKLPEKDTELALRSLALQSQANAIFERDIQTIDLRLPDRVVVTPVAAAEGAEDKKDKNKI